jgi:acetyl/propionyl-CoA carboxylase alpha subunit
MNTRLQVEHPVTEEVTGVDLVVAQLRVAAGEALPWRQDDIAQWGAAVEGRVYAEDPAKNFLPSPGTVTRLTLPEGEGIRVEAGITEGSTVSVHYDPLLMKLIARGADRAEAIARLDRALEACVIEGVRTTVPFLRRVMGDEGFRAGRVHTQMIEEGAFTHA